MGKDADTRVMFEHIAKPGNRSPLFWWLLEKHGEIAAALAGRRMQWKQFCADLTVMGITDTAGKAVTEANARKTWFRVRREARRLAEARRAADEARAKAAEVRRSYPSRAPKDLRPVPVLPAASTWPASAPAAETKEFKPWEDPNLSPEQAAHMKEQLDLLDRRQEWKDRHKRPLSKERRAALEREFGAVRPEQLANEAKEEE
jgi:hypothetical protein